MKIIDTKQIDIKYRGVRAYRVRYECKLKRAKLLEFCQDHSNKLKAKYKDGLISVALNFGGNEWRSGYLTKFGDQVRLYQYSDSDGALQDPSFFRTFVIYVIPMKPPQGGTDQHNDCLFYALKKAVINPLPWTYPATFKKYLGVGRDDKIDIMNIPTIEKKLRLYKINVTGDEEYISSFPSKLEINLKLKNQHYSLNVSDRQKLHEIAYEEKKPLFYVKIDGSQKLVYDGNEKKIITAEEYDAIKKNPITSDYLLIHADKMETIEEEYNQFIHDADIIKEKTGGLVNFYKTGRYTNTALKLFYQTSQCFHPEEI
ncbi:MAG: hypothetical protein RBS48_06140, partial [Ignavibacteriaceae bacterium]|nr:hypothetical protein [Ignavibacteriaceae bacterium]